MKPPTAPHPTDPRSIGPSSGFALQQDCDRWIEGHGPFARADWFMLHERHLWDRAPTIATWRDADRAVALPLLPDGPDAWRSAASWYSFTAAPITQGTDGIDAALSGLARGLASRAARLALSPLPTHDGGARAMAHALRGAGWRVHPTVISWRHALDWPPDAGDFASYWRQRPGRLRTTVARKRGRLDVSIASRFDPDDWAAYIAVHDASWKGPEGSPAFLEAFARLEGAAGRLRLGLARLRGAHGDLPPGTVVAAQLWTVEDDVAYIHKLSQRRDADALSPGSVLTAAMMARVIDVDGVRLVDFGTGDEPYKRDWMNRRDPLMRLDAFNLRRPSAWAPWLRSLGGRARRRLRGGMRDAMR